MTSAGTCASGFSVTVSELFRPDSSCSHPRLHFHQALEAISAARMPKTIHVRESIFFLGVGGGGPPVPEKLGTLLKSEPRPSLRPATGRERRAISAFRSLAHSRMVERCSGEIATNSSPQRS